MEKLEQKIEKYLLLNLLTVIRHYRNTYNDVAYNDNP